MFGAGSRAVVVIAVVASVLFVVASANHGDADDYSFTRRRTSGTEQSRVLARGKPQQVVLLPGPHKTGSSSIQKNVLLWTKAKGVLPRWVWPSLNLPNEGKNGKNFLDLVKELFFGSKTKTKDAYAKEFLRAWKKGKSIVFGNEYMDWVLRDSRNNIINGLLDMMPWSTDPTLYGSNNDITVSVTYRSPRVEHLISVWHQYGDVGKSLSQFLLELDAINWKWTCAMNPLGVADEFSKRGLSTVIIDTLGVKRDGLDISSVVACEVMGARCKNNFLVGLNDPPAKANVRSGKGEFDLSSKALVQIDEVIVRMDLSYCHLANATNVRVLHMMDLFSWCHELNAQSSVSSEQGLSLIQGIVGRDLSQRKNESLDATKENQ